LFNFRTILIVLMLGLLLTPNYATEEPIFSTDDLEMAYVRSLPSFPVPATCNCMQYARLLGVGDNVSKVPVLMGGVILNEGKIGHIGVIIEINDDNILIIESNYKPCSITYRRLDLNYNRIIGFVY
jgi:hypothetical protein